MLNTGKAQDYSKEPLQSIFHSLNKTDGSHRNLYESGFIDIEKLPIDLAQSTFSEESFKRELDFVTHITDEFARDYTSFFLLLKYGSRIGSGDLIDVPFADFERIRAAKELARSVSNGKVVLLKGDITGIQKYLYGNIDLTQVGGARQIAKRLRGRSFLVALLADFCAELFLEHLALPQYCLLFSGGGHFNLLLPAYNNWEKQVKDVNKELNKWLIQNYGINLGIVLGYSDEMHLDGGDLVSQFKQAKYRCGQAKYRKLEFIPELFTDDSILQSNIDVFKKNDGPIDQLGQQAPKASYLVQLKLNKTSHIIEDSPLWISSNGMTFAQILAKEDAEVKNLLETYKKDISHARIIRLNNLDFLAIRQHIEGQFNFPIGYGFRLVGNEAPFKSAYELMELEDIAAQCHPSISDTPLSYPQLAALRLDVDDLGFHFEHGFGNEVSLERIATLSRELHFFFGGYINFLAKNWNIYVVYSGGDDAFVLGSWVNIYHFAKELEEDFRKFTKGKKEVHFSAGIFTCNPHYPIAKVADDAKEQLDDYAKEFDGKNAIRVFNHSLSWEAFHQMTRFAHVLLSYMPEKGVEGQKPGKLARSLIRRLLLLVRSCFYEWEEAIPGLYQKTVKVDPLKFEKHKSYLRYLFARNGYGHEEVEKATTGIAKDVIQEFFSGNFSKKHFMKNYTVALNYVLQISRSDKN